MMMSQADSFAISCQAVYRQMSNMARSQQDHEFLHMQSKLVDKLLHNSRAYMKHQWSSPNSSRETEQSPIDKAT